MSGHEHSTDPAGSDGGSRPPKPGLPTRMDVRRAFDVYVYGRNRTLGPGQKETAVAGSPAAGSSMPRGPEAIAGVEAPGATVPVPRELRFDRNAGTWRDRLTGPDGGAS